MALFFSRDYFHLIRLYAYVVLLHVPLQQLAGAIVFWRSRRGVALLSGLVGVAILLIAIDAYFVEPYWLKVERVTIESRRITRPLRITVVADLQTDVIGPYEKRALQRVVDENPDLILFTGDYLHERDPRRYALLRGQLSTLLARLDLSAPLGVYAVRGNEADAQHVVPRQWRTAAVRGPRGVDDRFELRIACEQLGGDDTLSDRATTPDQSDIAPLA